MERPERMARSCDTPRRARRGQAGLRQRFDPDRESDRWNRRGRAKLSHQSVVASAGNQRLRAVACFVQLELESGVVVKSAPEGCGEARLADIDAAGGHEADP